MVTRRQNKMRLNERLRVNPKTRIHQTGLVFKQYETDWFGNGDQFIPPSFAKRMALAVGKDIDGVGNGLSPVEELRVKAAALRVAVIRRNNARSSVAAAIATAEVILRASRRGEPPFTVS